MIRPIRDYIIAKPFPSDEQSEGGIFVSEAHRPISNKMEVIAVGNGTRKHPMRFVPGDIVFRVKDDGNLIEWEGEKYFILKAQHLLAKQ